MNKKIKEYKFHEPLYFVDISVLIGGDVPQLIEFIKARHGDAQMYSFGEKFDWAEEAFAYYFGYVFQEIFKLLKGKL